MQDVIKRFGNSTYISWFSKLNFDSKKQGILHLKTSSPLVKDWIETYYDRRFQEIAKDNFKDIQKIKISVEKEMLNSNNIAQNTNTISKEPENKMEIAI